MPNPEAPNLAVPNSAAPDSAVPNPEGPNLERRSPGAARTAARLATALGFLAASSLGWAAPYHGAIFPGPGGGTPAGGGPPTAPAPTGPSAPSPASPPALGPAGPAPASTPAPTGGSVPTGARRGLPTIGSGGDLGLEPTSWQLWWRYNRDAYLDLKARVESTHPATGSDDPSRNEDRLRAGITAARTALASAKQRDLVSSLLVAIARSCDDAARAESPTVTAEVTPFVGDPDQEIGETAAAALGILRHPSGIPALVALLHDDETGRKLANGRVSSRTRAFAAYGLGIAAARSEREDLQAFVAHHLQRELDAPRKNASAELPSACVIALGLVPMPRTDAEASIRPRTRRASDAIPPRSRTAQAAALVRYLHDKDRPDLARAHVPDALARLADGAGAELREEIARELTSVLEAHSREPDGVVRGAVLALGRIADCDADASDLRMRIALRRALDSTEAQARLFALVSLAQVATRPGDGVESTAVESEIQALLVQRLARGRNSERSWAALALGILEHSRHARNDAPSSAVRAALHRALADAGSADQVGAVAIAMGLCGDSSATKDLLTALDDVRDPVGRGHVATALGLLGASEAIAPLRTILAKSRFQPELLRETAIALALLGDAELERTLLQELRDAKSLASQAGVARALGFAGTLSTVDLLVKMLQDVSVTAGARAFAAVALGMVCDRERVPWNAFLSAGVNYPSAPASLSDGSSGILDIL